MAASVGHEAKALGDFGLAGHFAGIGVLIKIEPGIRMMDGEGGVEGSGVSIRVGGDADELIEEVELRGAFAEEV